MADVTLSTRSKLRNRFRLQTYAELMQAVPPDWILQAYIPEDTLMMLYGPPNTFKSFIALDWALCVATGRPWLGAKVPKRRKVVYVSAEGQRGIARRVNAWLKGHACAASELTEITFVTCPVGITDSLEFKIFVENLEAMAADADAINGPELGLIILDTLARCFGEGDENSTQHMNAFVNACDELKRKFAQSVVLVIHHSGKDETLGARGSIAFHGATDVIFQTKARDGLRVTLANPRNKDMDEMPPRRLELFLYGDSLAVASCDEPADAPDRCTTRAFEAATGRAMELLGVIPRTEGITYTDWFNLGSVNSASTFHRYTKRLLNQGYVETRDGRYHLTRKGESSTPSTGT